MIVRAAEATRRRPAIKFLVTTKEGPILPPGKEAQEAFKKVVIPALSQLMALENAGKIVGGVPVGRRAFAFIMEADSSDEADRTLRALTNWRVTPLQSFEARAELERAAAEK